MKVSTNAEAAQGFSIEQMGRRRRDEYHRWFTSYSTTKQLRSNTNGNNTSGCKQF
jgi:hypothetical protein